MPGPQQRQLQYNVTLVPQTQQAEQAFARVAGSVDQVTKRLQAAQQESAKLGSQMGASNYPTSVFTPAPYESGGGSAGGGGGGAPGAKKEEKKDDGFSSVAMLAKVAFWVQAVGNLTNAVGAMSNEMTGAREKVLGFAAAVPIIGSAVESILASSFDMIERIRTDIFTGEIGDYDKRLQRTREMPFEAARNAARFGNYARLSDIQASDQLSESRAQIGVYAAYDQNKLRFAPELMDRSRLGTAAGGISGLGTPLAEEGVRFDEDKNYDRIIRQAHQAKLAAREARDIAQAQVNETADQIGSQRSRVGNAAAKSAVSFRRFQVVRQEAKGNPTHEAALQEASLEAERDRAELLRESQRYENLIAKSKQEQIAVLQQEQQLRRAGIGIAQAELEVVNQKLAKGEAAAEQFGTYDPAKQQAVLRAAQTAKEQGFEELSPEQKQLLLGSSVTSDYARNLSKKSGDNDTFRAIQNEIGEQDNKTLKAERQRLQARINTEVVIDAEKFKAELKSVLESGAGQALRDAIGNALKIELRGIDIKQMQGVISKK